MPEFRQASLTGQVVIIAQERAARPYQFALAHKSHAVDELCPFCTGNESLTPSEVVAFRPVDSDPDSPGWTVRVVPNKYPAVVAPVVYDKVTQDHPTKRGNTNQGSVMPGLGVHEVIIDTARHVMSLSELTPHEVAEMLAMYRQRLSALSVDVRWAYAQIFKNVGAEAGASLPHSHSQVVAIPFLPPSIRHRADSALEYFQKNKCCFWCENLQNELESGERIVEVTEHFAALCPFVSRFTGEVEIYPKKHESSFEQISQSLLNELATLFRRTIIRLENSLLGKTSPLAYNIVLQTEPFRWGDIQDDSIQGDSTAVDHNLTIRHNTANCQMGKSFHWHFSIMPSLARAAGFEWGTGLHINPISPEETALQLRNSNTRSACTDSADCAF